MVRRCRCGTMRDRAIGNRSQAALCGLVWALIAATFLCGLTSLAEDKEETCALVVSVIEAETGQPVSGAEIFVNGIKRGETDADGACFVDDVSEGRCVVAAFREGFARGMKVVTLERGKQSEVEILLKPGGVLMGVVLSETGETVPDASVRLQDPTQPRQTIRHVLTDINGIFSFDGLELERPYELTVIHGDFVKKVVTDLKVPADRRSLQVEVILDRGALLRGRITDAQGKPIEGAKVSLMMQGRYAFTAQDGVYVLDRLETGTGIVLVSAKGYRPEKRQIVIQDGENKEDFTLDKGHRIVGRVLGEDGKPLKDVRIYAYSRTLGTVEDTVTGADGVFALTSLPKESVMLRFVAEGYSDPLLPPVTVDGKPLTVVMEKTGHILGKVVNENGEPVKSFVLRLRPGKHRAGERVAQLARVAGQLKVDNEQGLFEIKGLTVGAPYRLYVFAGDYAVKEIERVVATRQDDPTRITVRLDRGVSFSGRVVDANTGEPISGAEVMVLEKGLAFLRAGFARAPISYARTAVTGANGEFEIQHISRGYHTVTIKHKDYAGLTISRANFGSGEAMSDRARRILRGTAYPLPPPGPEGVCNAIIKLKKGGTLVGYCLNRDGKPLPGIKLVITGIGVSAITDDNGYFELKNLPEGKHTLNLYDRRADTLLSRWISMRWEVEAKASEKTAIELVLYEGVPVRGKLVSGGQGVRGYVTIQPQDAAYPQYVLPTNVEGVFALPGLKPGRYMVTARTYDRRWRRSKTRVVTIDVEKGKKNEFEIQL